MAWIKYMELGNMLMMAHAIVLGALHRRESRGAHLREDFTRRNDGKYLHHTLIHLNAEGEYTLTTRPVVITKYLPKERTY